MMWNMRMTKGTGFNWGTLGLALIATQLVGCGWYVRPTCKPNCVPYYSADQFAQSGLGGPGLGGANGGAGGSGSPYGSDGYGDDGFGGKGRFDGQPKYMLDTVYFDYDSSEIRGDQQAALERNLAWMRQNPNEPLRIEGHCDERGTEEYNLALGDHRADAVRGWLIGNGADPSRMQPVSKGELEPADPGHDESAWRKNRRAEFLVLE